MKRLWPLILVGVIAGLGVTALKRPPVITRQSRPSPPEKNDADPYVREPAHNPLRRLESTVPDPPNPRRRSEQLTRAICSRIS